MRGVDLDENPGALINKLGRAMGVALDRRLRAYDVTIAQWKILAQLWQQEGRSQVELQEALSLEAATVTGLLQRMTAQGLIQRRADPTDKRVQRVFLTERSRALEQVLTPLLDEVTAQAWKGFTADEQDFLMRLLKRSLRNFEEGTD